MTVRAPLKFAPPGKKCPTDFWMCAPLLLAVGAAGFTLAFFFMLYLQIPLMSRQTMMNQRGFVVSSPTIQREVVAQTTTTSTSGEVPRQDSASQVTIEVRNGTLKTGAARTLGNRLKILGYTVRPPVDAVIRTYQKTIIAISSIRTPDPAVLRQLEFVTGGHVQELPPTEDKQTTDIVIIIGQDFAR